MTITDWTLSPEDEKWNAEVVEFEKQREDAYRREQLSAELSAMADKDKK